MPIAPENRHHYGREWRTVVRPRILARAEGRCEWCRRPNGERVFVFPDGAWLPSSAADTEPPSRLAPARAVRTVLTIAHLNHEAGDNRDENLAALCQRCHLRHDAGQHARNASRTRDRKRGQGRMWD